MSVQNIAAKKSNEVYKAIFVPNRTAESTTADEIYLEVGTHAECNAALQQHEANALKGKGHFLLKNGHFALLIADDRLLAKKGEIRAALEAMNKPAAQAQAEKAPAPAAKPQKAEKAPAPAANVPVDPMAGE